VDWINLAKDRVDCHAPLNMGNVLLVPRKAEYFLCSCVTVSF
jgi:hypothetical protein